jgi:hypothetical protein
MILPFSEVTRQRYLAKSMKNLQVLSYLFRFCYDESTLTRRWEDDGAEY